MYRWKYKRLILPISFFGALVIFLFLQAFWLKRLNESNLSEAKRLVNSNLEQIVADLENEYHCFFLTTSANLGSLDSLEISINGVDGQNILSDKLLLDVGDSLIPYQIKHINYGAPVEFQVILKGAFHYRDSMINSPKYDWIKKAYANTIFYKGEHLIDTTILKEKVEKLLGQINYEGNYSIQLKSKETNEAIYQLGKISNDASDLLFVSQIYGDKKSFSHPFELSIFLPELTTGLFFQNLYPLTSTLLIALLTIGLAIQLIISLKKTNALALAKEDLINNISHELKTPLSNIKLASDTIKIDQNFNAEGEKLISIIDEEAGELSEKLDYLLYMNRLDNQELKMRMKKVNVIDTLTKVIRRYELKIKEMNAEIITTFPTDSQYILADSFHLEQVFGNIIDNALKYSNGPAKIEIGLETKSGVCSVYIKDNGIGIHSSQINKIFDKFYRIESVSKTHNYKGFGIGLSYCKKVLEQLNGNIRVSSSPGKGSSFYINLSAA